MDVRLFLFIIIIVLGVVFVHRGDGSNRAKLSYISIVIFFLILESCLRGTAVGEDTFAYLYKFKDAYGSSWSDIYRAFYNGYVAGTEKDPGYLALTVILQMFTSNFNVFLFFLALIYFIPLGVFLYRYSENCKQLVFSFTLYIFLFNIVALCAVRQQVSTGLIFWAFLQLGEKKYMRCIIIIILASLIHLSAAVFILVPITKIFFMKYIRTIHLASLIAAPFVFVSISAFITYFTSFLSNDYYSNYANDSGEGGATNIIIIIELISLFCFVVLKKEDIEKDEKLALLYIMLPFASLLIPLVFIHGSMIRLSQYFHIFFLLLLPYTIDRRFELKKRNLIYGACILFLILFTLRAPFEYQFYWNDPLILYSGKP